VQASMRLRLVAALALMALSAGAPTVRVAAISTVADRTDPRRMAVNNTGVRGVMAAERRLATGDRRSTQNQKPSGATMYSSKRMADGRQWMTGNLRVNTAPSYCYDDAELNCRRYGRLYTWESARRACQSLGDGWRLPTDDEWRQMAKRYGGVSDDSDDEGRAAYSALVIGGRSGFNAVLGGGRDPGEGAYRRLEAHGFYWTASENKGGSAPFYNFGKGGSALHRQPEGNKQMAASVRCVRE
jgi:uncharacterized protein (TIGR02145 family)